MRAITIWPEWVWAITHLGKNVENRSRRTKVLQPGDEFAIHSGAYLGGSSKYVKAAEVFYPVDQMARRSGWRTGIRAADNVVVAYNVNHPQTVETSIHTLPYGSVVAIATFSGLLDPSCVPCNSETDWPWWDNQQFGYRLDDVRVLSTPIWCRGQQGLWNLPDEVEAAVRGNLSP